MKYHFNNSDGSLLKYNGQEVTMTGRFAEEGSLREVIFEDGRKEYVNVDELIAGVEETD